MSSLTRGLAVAALSASVGAQLTACWEVAGIEDRDVTRCPNPFVVSTNPDCAACLQDRCCEELVACADDPDCLRCTSPDGGLGDRCTSPATFREVRSCVDESCRPACNFWDLDGLVPPYCDALETQSGGACVAIGDFDGRVHCNPVTNDPCDGARGEACAFNPGTLTWSCGGTGHALPVCAECGLVEGGCVPGHDCANGRCYRYCCDDRDCAPFGRCQVFDYPDLAIGACVTPD